MMSDKSENWQGAALENVLTEYMKEQRRRRRWGIFFKLIVILFVLAVFGIISQSGAVQAPHKAHVALIDIDGEIGPGGPNSAEKLKESLEDAFKNRFVKAIILRVNSPGGTPVQSNLILDEILRLKKMHPKKKVYGVCQDICASGAYYVVVGADKIYADKASLVGSIGVVMRGFGFVDTLKKLGIERRVYTAGEHKDMLDPFLPVTDDDVAAADEMADIVHQQFIEAVKVGRGDKLKTDNPDIFSGRIWTGVQAKALGLIDEYGSVTSISEDVIHNTEIVDYTPKQPYFPNFLGMSSGDVKSYLPKMLADIGNAKLITKG